MKKVSKLALVLVATISFLCFLFYKSRYDKLYNVLEVLEFFGSDKVNEIKSTRFVIGLFYVNSFRVSFIMRHFISVRTLYFIHHLGNMSQTHFMSTVPFVQNFHYQSNCVLQLPFWPCPKIQKSFQI